MKQYFDAYNNVLKQKEISAGILLYRKRNGKLEVFLGKCGGPYFKKDKGAWNIPKGHLEENETLQEGAIREFQEQTSIYLNYIDRISLMYLKTSNTKSGKEVHIFALEKDLDPNKQEIPIKSNMCEIEYPPKSGQKIQIPELAIAKYVPIEQAQNNIFSYQKIFLQRLKQLIG